MIFLCNIEILKFLFETVIDSVTKKIEQLNEKSSQTPSLKSKISRLLIFTAMKWVQVNDSKVENVRRFFFLLFSHGATLLSYVPECINRIQQAWKSLNIDQLLSNQKEE